MTVADHSSSSTTSAAWSDARQSPVALEVQRGVVRLLRQHAIACVTELTLASGRRADVAGISETGEIWIVEIKSSVEDFRVDAKWPEYRDFCDRLLFAVKPDFPVAILPEEAGLILADRYGGEIVRPAPETRLAPARRKAMTQRLARTAAWRLSLLLDPSLATVAAPEA